MIYTQEKIISHSNMLSSVSIVAQRMAMLFPLNNPNFLLLHLLLGAGEVRPPGPQEPHRTLALCAVQGPSSRSPQGPSPPSPSNLPLQHSISYCFKLPSHSDPSRSLCKSLSVLIFVGCNFSMSVSFYFFIL